MTDIDFVEHDENGTPIFMVETKFGLVGEVDLNDPQFETMCWCAREEIPVFCVVYYPLNKHGRLVDAGRENEMVHIQFIVIGVNRLGREYYPKAKRLTELDWVSAIAMFHKHSVDDVNKYHNTWIDGVKIPHFINRPI